MAGKETLSPPTEESRQDTANIIPPKIHHADLTSVEARDAVRQWSSIGEQQALFRYLLDQLNDGIWILDPDSGVILDVNRAAHEQLGYSKEELVGSHMNSFVSALPHNLTLRQYLERRHNKEALIDGFHWHRDGSQIPMETNARLIDLDSRSYVISIARDITDRKHLEDELRQLSTIDSLTNVFNRRYFDDMLEQEWRRMMRVPHSLGLVMIDVDHFKHFNDTYGHVGGDICLRQIAAELKEQMRRAGDIIARYGGEEFAVILPETDITTAEMISELLRKSIEDLRMEHSGIDGEKIVTISVGVATLVPSANQTSLKLLMLADKALYAAKASGRNCVNIWRG